MTQEEFFFKVLEIRDTYSVKAEGDKSVVDAWPDEDGSCDIDLRELEIPSNVTFVNEGDVTLGTDELPENVKFVNDGDVYLYYVESIHSSVEFDNEGEVFLDSLVGGSFDDWEGNIEGVDNKRLLNLMISKGVFI